MITINTKLLNKYFLLHDNHNVLYTLDDNEELLLNEELVRKLLVYLGEIVRQNQSDAGLYCIDSQEQLLLYLAEHLYHTFKVFRNYFETEDAFILFLLVSLSLQLTLFSQNGLELIKLLKGYVKVEVAMQKKLYSFVDSNDTRGLFYYMCQINGLPYDRIRMNNLLPYEYTEPSINKKWQKQYKEAGKPIMFWFYDSLLGNSLFLVLYGPKCRYKLEKGGCAGCNLPTVSADDQSLNDDDIKRQVDNTFEKDLSESEKESIKEIVLSNNGSILDPKTISRETLLYTVEKTIKSLPNLKKIIFETRIDDYTDFEQLETLSKQAKKLNDDISLELAVGFEIFDDELRNGYYKKGIDKLTLEKKVQQLQRTNVSLKIYMMYKAVPDKYMDIDAAIDDINKASNYFAELAKQYGIKINLHINPTYLATGTQLYKDYKNGLYTPLTIPDIRKMFENLDIREEISYYISLNDEGLTDDRLSNQSDYEEYLELKEQINKFNIKNFY